MASDTSLPVTGKDIRVQVIVNGDLKIVSDEVTEFEDSDENETITTKPLGTSRRLIDKIHEGHSGTITFKNARKTIEQIRDEVNLARKNRVPIEINVSRSIFYRDGSSIKHVYNDLKLDFSSTDSRGDARTVTMNWETGEPRIASAA